MDQKEGYNRKKRLGNYLKIISVLSMVLLLSACSTIDSFKSKFKGGAEQVQEKVCPECPTCQDPYALTPDKVVYFFEKQQDGLLSFFTNSKEIYCIFPVMDDPQISQALLRAHIDKDVKLIFDRASSFTNCESACIPKTTSKYDQLISEGIESQVKNTNLRFCASDAGVYFYSGNFDATGILEAHVFMNPQLGAVYKDYFMKIYNG